MISKTLNQRDEGVTERSLVAARPALLVVLRGKSVVDMFKLTREQTIIGRSESADLRLNSKYVSSRHAIVEFDGVRASITDLCSRNRTLVNRKAVDKTQLVHGDIISLGMHTIIFEQRSESRRSKIRPIQDMRAAPTVAMEATPTDAGAIDCIVDARMKRIDTGSAVTGAAAARDGSASRATAAPVHGSDGPSDAGDVDNLETLIEKASLEDCGSILDVLEERSGLSPQALAAELGRIFEYKCITMHELNALEPDFDALSLAESRNRRCVLIKGDHRLAVVFCDPFDAHLRPWLEARLPTALDWLLVASGDINAYLSRHERSMRAMDSALKGADTPGEADVSLEDLSLASISQDSSPIVRLVHSTLYDALRAGASDIHMEAGTARLDVRYRIDGVLVHIATVKGAEIAEQVISRIKVMSELDISERRIPQDGRFKSAYEGRLIDFRVSIMPSSFGEDAVLRVLDKQTVTEQMTELRIDSLGFEPAIVDSLRHLSERPYGMLLVTGPTGSGKTTTLYAAISETNCGLGKIVTIEDPVEYQLAGVLQIPVNEKKGLTFARGLRSILRHDPDKIMVGEIRDPETAQIAVQSALTGHLVFTTVHANNVFDVLSRFTHMGVDPYSFVSALNGILAQRLLRIICENCAEKISPTKEMQDATGEPRDAMCTFKWRRGNGCSECRGTGYKGRKAIGELLMLDDEIREAIISRLPVRQLKELAEKRGLEFIRTAAIKLVRDGLTTIEEVNRVTTMA